MEIEGTSCLRVECAGYTTLFGKAPYEAARKRYLDLKDAPLPEEDHSQPDPPVVYKPDNTVLWRFSDYEAIVARVKASHEVAVKNGQAIRAKHTKNAACAIDLTTPYSPLEPGQLDLSQSTPHAGATAPEPITSAPNARSLVSFLAFLRARNFTILLPRTMHHLVFNSEWMHLEDPNGTPYYVNVTTLAAQRQAPATGEIVRPNAPVAMADQ